MNMRSLVRLSDGLRELARLAATSINKSLAIEQLLELEVPPKATWMRMLLCELNRIHSHLVWLATGALDPPA